MNSYSIFMKANKAWEEGNKKKAFNLLLKAALLGEHSAQHNVGYFYDVGEGIEKNIDKALYWYKKAWRNGKQTDTCINIAQLYLSIGKNRLAIFWLSKAIQRGDGDAALELAKFYLSREKNNDTTKAISLLKSIKRSKYVSEDAVNEAEIMLKKR